MFYPDALGVDTPTPKPVPNCYLQKNIFFMLELFGEGAGLRPHSHDATCICTDVINVWGKMKKKTLKHVFLFRK